MVKFPALPKRRVPIPTDALGVRSRTRSNFLSVKRCFSIPRVPRSLVNLIGLEGQDSFAPPSPPLRFPGHPISFIALSSMQHFQIRSVAKWGTPRFLLLLLLRPAVAYHFPRVLRAQSMVQRIYVFTLKSVGPPTPSPLSLPHPFFLDECLQEVRQRERPRAISPPLNDI